MTDLVPLDKLLSRVVDNRGKTCPTAENGLPLIATNCVKNDGLFPTLEKVRYVSDETYHQWFRGHPEPGDLIFVTKGAPGQVCLAPEPVNFCIAQDMVALRADDAAVYPPYLFAALRSRQVQDAIANMHVGTMIPHFKKGDFDKLLIPRPDRRMQHFIGDIYLLLSRKVELNRRINETLEAMARAIFKDWFVDFGPTRAKMEGRAPYLAPEIWALFPDQLDDEGKPEGWVFDRLETIADLNWGDTNTTKQSYSKTGYTAFSASGPDGLLPYYDFDRLGIVLSAIGANCGMTWLAQGKWSCIKNTIRLWPKAEYLPTEYLFLATYGSEFWPKRGSAQPFISQGDARNIRLLVPPPPILRTFGGCVHPLYEKTVQVQEEAKVLAHTRDLLLPKLMSGEIRVKQAEKVTEAVV